MPSDNKSSGNPFDILNSIEFTQEEKERFANQKTVDEKEPADMPDYSRHKIRIWLEKKRRGGKTVSVITGFDDTIDLKKISKQLKNKMGVGGSFDKNQIIIQGKDRDKIMKILKSLGFKDIKKAGG